MPPKSKKSSSHRPLWLKRLSWRIFPRGPRGLYCYLAAFPGAQCWLYNYRLALTFDVTIRTVQLWLKWLTKMSLVHIYWLHGQHRRIVCHHFKNSTQWLAAAALPKPLQKYRRYPQKSTSPAAWSKLQATQFEARRQALIRSLQGRK